MLLFAIAESLTEESVYHVESITYYFVKVLQCCFYFAIHIEIRILGIELPRHDWKISNLYNSILIFYKNDIP